MKRVVLKRPRMRLDAESYRKLRERVLERDGWRCQRCGSAAELHVHHLHPRSLLGDDMELNLMTLCCRCHREVHRQEGRGAPVLRTSSTPG